MSSSIRDGVLALQVGMELCQHCHGSTAATFLLGMAQAVASPAHPYLWRSLRIQGVPTRTLRLLRSL